MEREREREKEKGRGSRSLCISIPKRQDGDIGKAREGRKLLTSLENAFVEFAYDLFISRNGTRERQKELVTDRSRFCFSASSVLAAVSMENVKWRAKRGYRCVRWLAVKITKVIWISAPTCEFSRGDAGCLIERDRRLQRRKSYSRVIKRRSSLPAN